MYTSARESRCHWVLRDIAYIRLDEQSSSQRQSHPIEFNLSLTSAAFPIATKRKAV